MICSTSWLCRFPTAASECPMHQSTLPAQIVGELLLSHEPLTRRPRLAGRRRMPSASTCHKMRTPFVIFLACTVRSHAVVWQLCDLLVVPGLASAGSFRELLDENLSAVFMSLCLVTRVCSPSKKVVSLVAMATRAQGSDFSQAAGSAGLTAGKSSQSN